MDSETQDQCFEMSLGLNSLNQPKLIEFAT